MFAYALSRVAILDGVVISGAGSSNTEEEVYPAASAVAVAVTDVDDYKASYSNYGEWVNISAPGNPIVVPLLDRRTTASLLRSCTPSR